MDRNQELLLQAAAVLEDHTRRTGCQALEQQANEMKPAAPGPGEVQGRGVPGRGRAVPDRRQGRGRPARCSPPPGRHGRRRPAADGRLPAGQGARAWWPCCRSVNGDKITFLAVCGKEAVARGVKAGDLVKAGLPPSAAARAAASPTAPWAAARMLLKVDDALAAGGRLCFRKNLLNPGERS